MINTVVNDHRLFSRNWITRRDLQSMAPIHRPNSNQRHFRIADSSPSQQSVPFAMEMMVESMVKMMQSARTNDSSESTIQF